MTAQIVFHGINRSAAVEAAVNEKLEGLAKFDNQIGPCKVTVTQEGHQTMGPFHHPCGSRRIRAQFDRYTHESGRHGCPSESFDTIRRSVVEEADKRRQH